MVDQNPDNMIPNPPLRTLLWRIKNVTVYTHRYYVQVLNFVHMLSGKQRWSDVFFMMDQNPDNMTPNPPLEISQTLE